MAIGNCLCTSSRKASHETTHSQDHRNQIDMFNKEQAKVIVISGIRLDE